MDQSTWVLGYSTSHNPNDREGGMHVSFSDSMEDFRMKRFDEYFPRIALTMSSVSDSLGNLLFYTNGCNIYDADNEIIEDGERLTGGTGHLMNTQCRRGYNIAGHSITVPIPNSKDRYYVFYGNLRDAGIQDSFVVYSDSLFYTEVSVEHGYPEIIEKDVLILNDTLSKGRLKAVQKGGKDGWWLIVSERWSDRFYILDISGNGIKITKQRTGPRKAWSRWGFGDAAISPDGRYYAYMNPRYGLFVYRFDPMSGQIDFDGHMPFWGDLDKEPFSGFAFSPNSKLMYVTANTKVYQIPVDHYQNRDSILFIEEYDGFKEPFEVNFLMAQLAINNKIYITAGNSATYMHVIHEPDIRGKECRFDQRGRVLPYLTFLTVPNFPVYLSSEYQSGVMSIENCSSDIRQGVDSWQISFPDCDIGQWEYTVFDVAGRMIGHSARASSEKAIEVGHTSFSAGAYIVKIRSDMGERSLKLMKY